MDTSIMMDELSRAIEQLLGRTNGPMHIRLFLQPAIAIIFAFRAGLKDARENRPPFIWRLVKNATQRKTLLYSAWVDIGQVITTAFLIDAVYQLFVLKAFYLLQALIVTFVLAVLPYIILRGIITRVRRYFL